LTCLGAFALFASAQASRFIESLDAKKRLFAEVNALVFEVERWAGDARA
jgi:hypothetical protein